MYNNILRCSTFQGKIKMIKYSNIVFCSVLLVAANNASTFAASEAFYESGFEYLDTNSSSARQQAQNLVPFFKAKLNLTEEEEAEPAWRILELRRRSLPAGNLMELVVQLVYLNGSRKNGTCENCSDEKDGTMIFCKASVLENIPLDFQNTSGVSCSEISGSLLSPPEEDLEQKFTLFREKFNKTYDTQGEYEDRRSVFSSTLHAFHKANLNPYGGFVVNQYSDYTLTEFLQCGKKCKYDTHMSEYLTQKCAKDGPKCPATMFQWIF